MLVVRFDANCLVLFQKQTFFSFVNCKDKKKKQAKKKRFFYISKLDILNCGFVKQIIKETQLVE